MPRAHADFDPAPVELRRSARGQSARPVALAAQARRGGRLARGGRQPPAAQPGAVAGARRASSSGGSSAMRGRGGTSIATASRPRLRERCTDDRRGPARNRRRADRLARATTDGARGRLSAAAARGRAADAAFAYAFNCTGPLHSIARTRDPLLRSLLDAGQIRDRSSRHRAGRRRPIARGRPAVGARAADQGPLLGDHRGARYSGAGGGGRRRYRAGAWPMSSIEHGEPEDGDLVERAPPCEIPERRQRGGADADPLGRRRSRTARACSIRRAGLRALGRNMRAAMRRTRRSISAEPSRRSAAMTRSCC